MSDNTPIIDMPFALSQLSGNQALVEQLFSRFQQDYQDASETLGNQLPNIDVASAKSLVHTIKGVAGNLGLKRLHLAAKALEDAIKANQHIDEMKAAFDEVLQATLNEISQLLSAEEAPQAVTSQPGSDMDATAAKRELSGLLERHEFIPPDKLASLMESITGSAEAKQQIEDAINDLDYETASQTLDSL